MKKATSILLAVYFLVGSLTPKMDFEQLLHLACAIDHYGEHQLEATESGAVFTIADFLMDHYLDPANHPQKKENGHQQEHPCSHSHNHTVDIAKIDMSFPDLHIVEEDLMVQVFPNKSHLYSADFTVGLDEPPTLS